ncbi:MAG: hypothetical protein AAF696_32480, partial [Bacteroidota bacterium]
EIAGSLAGQIDGAVAKSAYCISVISQKYLDKNWTMNELWAFYARESSQEKRIIPLWHNLGIEEIKIQLPLLADRFAISSEKPMDEIVAKIVAFVNEKPYKNPRVGLWPRMSRFAKSQTGKASGLIGLIIGALFAGKIIINQGENNQFIEIDNMKGDININEGLEERYTTAWQSMETEMCALFTSLISIVSLIESDFPEPYPYPKGPGDVESVYQDRARIDFRKYPDRVQINLDGYPRKRAQYDNFLRDLAKEPEVKRKTDIVYDQLEKVERIVLDYKEELVRLQQKEIFRDSERTEKAQLLHRLKVLDAKIALMEAASTYSQLPASDPNYPVKQFRFLKLGIEVPARELSSQDWHLLFGNLYKQRSEVFREQINSKDSPRKREIQRLLRDPYLKHLRKMRGRSDTLDEGEYLAIINNQLDSTETDPIALLELAAFSFLESDGYASIFYLKQALKNEALSEMQDLYIRLSIDRLENPDLYQGSIGIMVLKLDEGGNLDLAGIRIGDVLVGLEGKTIQEAYEISNALGKMDKESVVLDVIRNGESKRIVISGKKSVGAHLSQLVVLNAVHI